MYLQSGWYDKDGSPMPFDNDGGLVDYVIDNLSPQDFEEFKEWLKEDPDETISDVAKAWADQHYSFKYEEGYF